VIDRRSLLIATGAALIPGALRAAAGSPVLPLWPHPPAGGPEGPVQVSARGAISNIAIPTLEIFAPARPNGAAVLVAGGGGYKRIEMANEAYPAARWLAQRGITAFVLSYRLPGEGWRDGPLAPLQDAQRALRMIRAGAGARIDPQRIGVLGFSAGAHLLGLAATRSAFASYPPIDTIDSQSARPGSAALLYPIVTLEPPYQHTSTRRMLIGDHPAPGAAAQWSVQSHVRAGCPPLFLVQAEDDPISDPANTRILAEAGARAGVPVEMHRLASGGHGFGMGRAGTPSAQWPSWYEAWLRRAGMIR
jgi:acetyl esterase/lipase